MRDHGLARPGAVVVLDHHAERAVAPVAAASLDLDAELAGGVLLGAHHVGRVGDVLRREHRLVVGVVGDAHGRGADEGEAASSEEQAHGRRPMLCCVLSLLRSPIDFQNRGCHHLKIPHHSEIACRHFLIRAAPRRVACSRSEQPAAHFGDRLQAFPNTSCISEGRLQPLGAACNPSSYCQPDPRCRCHARTREAEPLKKCGCKLLPTSPRAQESTSCRRCRCQSVRRGMDRVG